MATPSLQIEVVDVAPRASAKIVGDLDLTTADALQTCVTELLDSGAKTIQFDLGGLGFIDSTGLGALVLSHRLTGERNATLELANVPERVLRLMEITKLTDLLSIAPPSS